MSIVPLVRLTHELGIWRRAWKVPVLWWRDDDAQAISWQLKRLLEARKGLPLTLAVIPQGDLKGLGLRLGAEAGVTVAQHGVDHINRLPEGGPRSEFQLDQQQASINAAMIAGRTRLLAAGMTPIAFVPPWNEPDDRQIAAVKAAGYGVYSIGIHGRPRDGLAHFGAQVDILRWKGKPRFRGDARILNALRKELEARRKDGRFEEPIGLLTHHLVHDEAAWSFLNWFVGYSRTRFAWAGLQDLIAADRDEAEADGRDEAVASSLTA